MAQIDSKENSVVAVCPQHCDAENAINLLKKSDFSIKRLAIVGQGVPTLWAEGRAPQIEQERPY